MTVRTLLVRGMLVGVVAALLALGFAELIGEPEVDRAITFEAQRVRVEHETPAPTLVNRDIQKSIGVATAVTLYSVAFGGLFALAFAVAFGRVGRLSARSTAAVLALGGYLALVVVPFLKYPANPPAIGNPETIERRTALYFGMLLISLLLAIFAVRLGRQLLPRLGGWDAALIAGGVFVVGIALVQLVLPAVEETPPDFPATVLWRFRLAALGTQLVLWATFGLLFGALTERSLRASRRVRRQREHEPV